MLAKLNRSLCYLKVVANSQKALASLPVQPHAQSMYIFRVLLCHRPHIYHCKSFNNILTLHTKVYHSCICKMQSHQISPLTEHSWREANELILSSEQVNLHLLHCPAHRHHHPLVLAKMHIYLMKKRRTASWRSEPTHQSRYLKIKQMT